MVCWTADFKSPKIFTVCFIFYFKKCVTDNLRFFSCSIFLYIVSEASWQLVPQSCRYFELNNVFIVPCLLSNSCFVRLAGVIKVKMLSTAIWSTFHFFKCVFIDLSDTTGNYWHEIYAFVGMLVYLFYWSHKLEEKCDANKKRMDNVFSMFVYSFFFCIILWHGLSF